MKNPPPLIPCLLDFRAFFKKSGHLYFPATICFPQYFAFAIETVVRNARYAALHNDKEVAVLCRAYFDILPVIVDRIYGGQRVRVDGHKLRRENLDADPNFTLLETYLRDEQSVLNYRRALLNAVLTYHNCPTLTQYLDHLKNVECCAPLETPDLPAYPSSEHYLLLGVRANNVKVQHLNREGKIGTKLWGPFFWNIFHAIVEGEGAGDDEQIFINFIYVLPFTLPCGRCTFNYIDKMPSFARCIEEYRQRPHRCLKTLYSQIHDVVNYAT